MEWLESSIVERQLDATPYQSPSNESSDILFHHRARHSCELEMSGACKDGPAADFGGKPL